MVVNWDQTLAILRRLEGKLRATPKVNLVVDVALFVAAVTVVLSGLLISQSVARTLGIVIAPDPLWVGTHSWSADAVILLLLLHFVLHWCWIVTCAQRLVRRHSSCDAGPVVAVRLEARRLEQETPAPLRYATVPVRAADRSRP